MFAPVMPRLKGGLNRLIQALAAGYYVLKGPPENDLMIVAGDNLFYGTGNSAGRTLVLKGGAATGPGTDATQNATGGGISLVGADGGSNFGAGGPISLTAGRGFVVVSGSLQQPSGATMTFSGGTIAGDGGAATLTGGQSGGGVNRLGGGLTIKGGLGGNGGRGGHVTLQTETGTSNFVYSDIRLDNGAGGFVTMGSRAANPTNSAVPNPPTNGLGSILDSSSGRMWIYSGSWIPQGGYGADLLAYSQCGGL